MAKNRMPIKMINAANANKKGLISSLRKHIKKRAEIMLNMALAITSTTTSVETTPGFPASLDLSGNDDAKYPNLPTLKSLPSIPKKMGDKTISQTGFSTALVHSPRKPITH
ncbi:MAG: hypothetical protein QW341_05060 [Candidatus Bathyarchaeia archaeon]